MIATAVEPMSYCDYTLEGACRTFDLEVVDEVDLFVEVSEVPVGRFLRSILAENFPLATAIHTEKARSELIVAPILVEVRRLMDHRISLFSGIDFNVDPERGLRGTCDFILARSSVQLFLEAPVLDVVEAKNNNIKSGLGQCLAAMVASRLFNERRGHGPSTIFGVVTTGSLWRFLKLEGQIASIDRPEYTIDSLGKILAILLHCVGGPPGDPP